LLEQATILNQIMAADLSDEQAKKMNDEIVDVKNEWQILMEGLNKLEERLENRFYQLMPSGKKN
jgi:hypothetical protein